MLSPNQLKAARALVGWSQEELAALTGVHPVNIKNFERGMTKSPRYLEKVKSVFSEAGLVFIEDHGMGVMLMSSAANPGIRARNKGQGSRRVA